MIVAIGGLCIATSLALLAYWFSLIGSILETT
jgi:hypothetical protein